MRPDPFLAALRILGDADRYETRARAERLFRRHTSEEWVGWLASVGRLPLLAGRRARAGQLLLLSRLDDPALVPLWLEMLPAQPSPRRSLYLARLAQHLPSWHTWGECLPDPARRALLAEVRRLASMEWTDAELTFLTAALLCLDHDPARGVPADESTKRALIQLQGRWGNARLMTATESALQRTSCHDPQRVRQSAARTGR